MEATIRLLSTTDAAAFRTLRLQSYQEAPLAFSESYEDERHKPLSDFVNEVQAQGNPPEWFVLGAFSEEDQLIGFVKFRRDKRSKARHKSMVHAMYVDPQFRKMGVGEKLMKDLLGRVRELPGLEQIHLWVLYAETSAADFYEKIGFASQGPLVRKDLKIKDRYVDAGYMVMHLD